MKCLSPTYLLAAVLLLTALPAVAEDAEPGWGHGKHGSRGMLEMGPPPPYGAYCPRRHADQYGARQPVQTREEAQERLGLFFKIPPAQITLRRELKMGYIADINNPDGSLSDRVIIDKRSGRIRSIR
jgi:hypothetical protein